MNPAVNASPAQLQQKMMRQRQLMLARQRGAAKMVLGGMAQANQHAPTGSCVQNSNMQGWGASVESGPEFPDKVNTNTFSSGKVQATPTPKEKGQMNSMETLMQSTATRLLKDPLTTTQAIEDAMDGIAEIHIDSTEDARHHVDMQPRQANKERGWNLEIEDHQQQQANKPQSDAKSRRWFRPWGGKAKPSETNCKDVHTDKDANANTEITQISHFGNDRIGVCTPDSDAGRGFQRGARGAHQASTPGGQSTPGGIEEISLLSRRADATPTNVNRRRTPSSCNAPKMLPGAAIDEDEVFGFDMRPPKQAQAREEPARKVMDKSWNLSVDEPHARMGRRHNNAQETDITSVMGFGDD